MDLGGLLVRQKRPDEAVPILRECLATFPDARVHDLLCSALLQSGEHEAALRAANEFLAFAKDDSIRALAHYHVGAAQESLGQTDAALAAYLEGSRLDPAGHNAFHAAALLQARGNFAEALRLLDQYIPHGSGWRLESARKRQESIAAAGATATP
jgi:tetratricopeptide (TPR) repeat protein